MSNLAEHPFLVRGRSLERANERSKELRAGSGTWPLPPCAGHHSNRACLASEPGFGAHCWDNPKQNASLRWSSKTTLNRPQRGRRATVLARERSARIPSLLQDPVCRDWFRCFRLLLSPRHHHEVANAVSRAVYSTAQTRDLGTLLS